MKRPNEVSTYTMLTTESDNQTKSPIFMAVWFATFIVLPVTMLTMIGLSFTDVVVNKHEASVAGLGGGIAAMLGGLGGFVAGMAALLAMDKRPDPPLVTHTTTTTATGEAALAAAPAVAGEDDGKRKAKAKP